MKISHFKIKTQLDYSVKVKKKKPKNNSKKSFNPLLLITASLYEMLF